MRAPPCRSGGWALRQLRPSKLPVAPLFDGCILRTRIASTSAWNPATVPGVPFIGHFIARRATAPPVAGRGGPARHPCTSEMHFASVRTTSGACYGRSARSEICAISLLVQLLGYGVVDARMLRPKALY